MYVCFTKLCSVHGKICVTTALTFQCLNYILFYIVYNPFSAMDVATLHLSLNNHKYVYDINKKK